VDQITGLIKRFMAIITAPVLLNGGWQVDYGFFCRDCRDEVGRNMHSKIKYTAEEIPGHIARYGRIVEYKQGLVAGFCMLSRICTDNLLHNLVHRIPDFCK